MGREFTYPAIVSNNYMDGMWVANFVGITGCWSEGEDREDVVRRAPEVLAEWLKSCVAADWPIPEPISVEELKDANAGEVILVKVTI